MQLLPGESEIATLGNVTLTTRRVQYEKSEWGSKKVTAIPLDHLTSCDIEAHSEPKWIVLTVLTVIVALYTEWGILWGLSVFFGLVWLLTFRKSMVLRSASEKIEYAGSFGQWTALQEFLQKVHVAKGNQESVAAGRHQEVLAAFRASAVQPVPARQEEAIRGAVVRTAAPESTPHEEDTAAPTGAAFWVASSSTLHISRLSAAPAIAPEVARKETEHRPPLDSPVPEQPTASDVESIAVPANIGPSSAVSPLVEVQSQSLCDTETRSPEGVNAAVLPGQSVVAEPLPTKSMKRQTRMAVMGLSVLAMAGLLGAAIFLFRSRPVDFFTTENRALVNAELQRWSESFRTGNTSAHVNCYAPVIETYFKMHQLPREQLFRDKQEAFAAVSVVMAFELSNIQLSAEPNNRISATFQKDWDYSMNSGKGFLGSEIEKLTFENFSGEWKIIKEEELRIIRTTHPVRHDARLDDTTATQAGAFRFAKYSSSYLAEELCSESMPVSSFGRYCYPYGWRPWLKELKRNVAGSATQALDNDTGTQIPGNVVIWWDSEPRVVFSGCRPHDCPNAGAYFIVAPRTRQMDILWRNERGVSYLGPNGTLLRGLNGFALLEQIERGDASQN